MKIVILGTAWPYRGGLAAFNERLAKQFVIDGHDVEVLTFTLQYPAFYSLEKRSIATKLRQKVFIFAAPFILVIHLTGYAWERDCKKKPQTW